jgi:DNA invertase Pin-like site-specific DNA recombinase
MSRQAPRVVKRRERVTRPQLLISTRVSTDEQGEGGSHGAQEAECRRFAESRFSGWPIARVFGADESGWHEDRPKFEDGALRFLREIQGVAAIITWDVKRFSRNVAWGLRIWEKELKPLGVELWFADEPEIDLYTPRGLKMFTWRMAEGRCDSDSKSVLVRERMKTRRRGAAGNIRHQQDSCGAGHVGGIMAWSPRILTSSLSCSEASS